MKLIDVPIENFTFADGSMNARQYHAWLWAKIPKDATEAELKRAYDVIAALTTKFMFDSLDDPPPPPAKGGLASLFK
jgi:hypothetical protein